MSGHFHGKHLHQSSGGNNSTFNLSTIQYNPVHGV